MRDIGTLVWVVLVFIGVIGSMISSVRKQVQTQQGASARATRRPPPQFAPPQAPTTQAHPMQAPAQQAPQPQTVARPRPAAARAQAAPVPAHPVAEPQHAPRRRLFANRGDLVRGIIAAEVLGKPRGLRGEDFPR